MCFPLTLPRPGTAPLTLMLIASNLMALNSYDQLANVAVDNY